MAYRMNFIESSGGRDTYYRDGKEVGYIDHQTGENTMTINEEKLCKDAERYWKDWVEAGKGVPSIVEFAEYALLRYQIEQRNTLDVKLVQKAKALIDKIDEIHENDSYKSVWTVAQIHHHPYTGPNYKDELKLLRAALKEIDEG